MSFFLELDWCQKFKHGQMIGGDRIFMERYEDRSLLILSDGLGSGIKANVLATLTGVMALQYVKNQLDITNAAKIIMNTLPVCNERKISYSTFTICDISNEGLVKMVEYDNPSSLLLRDGRYHPIEKKSLPLNRAMAYKKEVLHYSETQLEYGDRVVIFSDGVSQAGLGSAAYPLGWREKNISAFLEERLKKDFKLSAHEMATSLTSTARYYDGGKAKDDITAAVVYYREPRELLIVTGPPMDRTADKRLAEKIENFCGPVIVSGGTTATIISRELEKDLKINIKERTKKIPPTSEIEGIDLVTEGMLTLNRVAEILENREESEFKKSHGAGRFCSLLLDSDMVNFIVGTRVNEAHHDPSIPDDIGIRRTIVRRIGTALEKFYLKRVKIEYL